MSDLDKSMADVIDSQPEVSEGVKGPQNDKNDTENLFDNYNRSFNPQFHIVDDDGKPELTKKGKLRVKKGQSPSKIAKAGVPSQQPESYKQCAQVVCGSIFGFGQLVAGEDAKPSPDQAQFMVDSYERYFEVKGIEDIPPGLAVFLSTAAYAIPVAIKAMNRKESKLYAGYKKLRDKFAKRKVKEPKQEK